MFLIYADTNYEHATTFAIGCPDICDQLVDWLTDVGFSAYAELVSVDYAVECCQNLTEEQKDTKQVLLKRFFEETRPTESE